MSVYLVQSVGWGVLPVPHHEAARPRPQHVPRLRLRPAVVLLRLVLGVDDCNEAGIGGVSEGVVWGVCQQLGGVPGGCNTDLVRGNSEHTTCRLGSEKQSCGSIVTCPCIGKIGGMQFDPKMKKKGSCGRLQAA